MTSYVGGSYPGAYEGNKALRIYRENGTSSDSYAGYVHGAYDLQDTTGDIIHFEEMIFVSSTSQGCAQIHAYDNLNEDNSRFKLITSGNSVLYYGEVAGMSRYFTITGITFALNTWQKWKSIMSLVMKTTNSH